MHFFKAINGVTRTTRGCHQYCVNSSTTECCSSDNCNKAEVIEPPFACYDCITVNEKDACGTGDTSSVYMKPTTCASGLNYCYKQTRGKIFFDFV